MKKTLLTLVLFSISVMTFAQTIHLGIKAGVNLSNQTFSGATDILPSKNLTGFNAGGILDIGFNKFSIQPGVFYTTKGRKYKMGIVDANQTFATTAYLSIRLNYIEMPVNFLYKFNAGTNTKIYVGGGPYLGIGISRNSSTSNYPDGDVSTSSSFGGDSGYKNPDYGLNATAGVEINNKIIIGANYGYGLANITPATGVKLYNETLSFSVGYLFR
jgi:hypothetical protein